MNNTAAKGFDKYINKSWVSDGLLEWYDVNARDLPWRIPPDKSINGIKQDPYKVWLSEIMLQQTQVVTVRDYYLKFLCKWPCVQDLAYADIDDVMKAWAGLGYYSRARNLKKCAELIVSDHGGVFPEEVSELKKLPGIGDYTSSAIAAIAFGKVTSVVDGNIERVISRFYRITTPLPKAKNTIKALVKTHVPDNRTGDFAQAMMDLGASICSPKTPSCAICPLSTQCQAFTMTDQELYPVKQPKAGKPTRIGAAFVIQNKNGDVFLSKRANKGLLGGMSEVPGTTWDSRKDGETGEAALPFKSKWKKAGIAKHTFTHFHLELEIWHTNYIAETDLDGWWSSLDNLGNEALPSVMKKAIEVAIPKIFKNT